MIAGGYRALPCNPFNSWVLALAASSKAELPSPLPAVEIDRTRRAGVAD